VFKYYIYAILLVLQFCSVSQASDLIELNSLLNEAYKVNASIKTHKNRLDAAESLISSKYTLDDPMIGVSNLERGNDTTYGVISQKIRFPVKYYLQGKAQKSRSRAAKADFQNQRNEVRKAVTVLYYSLFSLQKIIQLTEANMQAVRDFSRVAERKYAAGKSSQGDSMKAHVELTRLELDLIRFKQQEDAMQAGLAAIMNNPSFNKLDFKGVELNVPVFNSTLLDASVNEVIKTLKESSPKIKKENYLLDAAKTQSTLAKWEFAPDIQLQYQERISGQPEDSRIYSVSLSLPLWFWKKGAESSAANSLKMAQEYKYQSHIDHLLAKIKDLKGKVSVGQKTLNIYKTSLIPQAQGAYNSSKASYRANKTTFLDLLDSERSLFGVRTGYYNALKDYVSNLLELETELGFVVSDLDQGEL
tara:strand:- start:10149 stop:11399 length:1251 start_codon:yes stop_codon:yes gene_type:complete